MDTSQIPKMQSAEKNGDGRPINLPGIYRLKGAKNVPDFVTAEGDEGVAQADAVMSSNMASAHGLIWERVGDVPTRLEILETQKAQEIKEATADALAKGKEEADMKAAKKAALEAAKATEASAPAK